MDAVREAILAAVPKGHGEPVEAPREVAGAGGRTDDGRPLQTRRVEPDPAALPDDVGGHALERGPVEGVPGARVGLPRVGGLDVEPPDVGRDATVDGGRL